MKEHKRFTRFDKFQQSYFAKGTFQEIIDYIGQLEDKIENGTLIELPCKVGDKVYKVVKDFIAEYRVHKIEFYILSDKQFGYCVYCDNYELGDFDYFYKKQVGETWFITKAEAEAKLKELKGE